MVKSPWPTSGSYFAARAPTAAEQFQTPAVTTPPWPCRSPVTPNSTNSIQLPSPKLLRPENGLPGMVVVVGDLKLGYPVSTHAARALILTRSRAKTQYPHRGSCAYDDGEVRYGSLSFPMDPVRHFLSGHGRTFGTQLRSGPGRVNSYPPVVGSQSGRVIADTYCRPHQAEGAFSTPPNQVLQHVADGRTVAHTTHASDQAPL